MTTEAIATKLAYLLSWPGMTLRQLRHYMGKSLRGEITEAPPSPGAGTLSGAATSSGGDLHLTMNDISGSARRASEDGGGSHAGLPRRMAPADTVAAGAPAAIEGDGGDAAQEGTIAYSRPGDPPAATSIAGYSPVSVSVPVPLQKSLPHLIVPPARLGTALHGRGDSTGLGSTKPGEPVTGASSAATALWDAWSPHEGRPIDFSSPRVTGRASGSCSIPAQLTSNRQTRRGSEDRAVAQSSASTHDASAQVLLGSPPVVAAAQLVECFVADSSSPGVDINRATTAERGALSADTLASRALRLDVSSYHLVTPRS